MPMRKSQRPIASIFADIAFQKNAGIEIRRNSCQSSSLSLRRMLEIDGPIMRSGFTLVLITPLFRRPIRKPSSRNGWSSSPPFVSSVIGVIVAIGFPLSVNTIAFPDLTALMAFEKFWFASRNPILTRRLLL